MGAPTEPEKSSLARLFLILVAVWLSLGLVSSFFLVIGLNFIPSTEWAAATHHLRMILGLVCVPLLVWVVWKGGEKAKASQSNRVFVASFSAVFGYFLGGNILFIWPLLLPLIAGYQVALPFTVLRATDIGVKYCHSPVKLRWAITFVCQFGLLSGVRVMSSAEFIEMITAEAKCDGDEVNSLPTGNKLILCKSLYLGSRGGISCPSLF